MLSYKYTARDPTTGKRVRAEVQAENEQVAAKLIMQQGLSPLEVKPSNTGFFQSNRLLHRVRAKDRILFSRQLATLINAGLPLVQSLRSVAKQTQNKTLKLIINQIITDIEGGLAFSASL